MLRSVWLALVLSTAAAAATVDLPKLRHLSEAQPAQALADGRQLLDGGKLSDDPADAREVLRWMGRAALILADETAIAEVVLRLDGLAQTHADSVAKAYAGFLRAQHLAMQGHAREGLAEALGSADLLQEQKDPNLLALSDYNLCNAYYEAEEFSRALPFCQRAGDRSHQVGDGYEEARANNLEAIVRLNQNDNAAAIALLEHARDRMHALGEESMVVTFNDNLARLYIEQGRAAEALELARKAYEGDRAAGKLSYTALGRANIARALSALKRHDEAQTEIAASVDEARANKQASLLSDLLDTQSMIAEAAGDLKLALKSLRESHDIDQKNAPKQASGNTSISDLEARFATREKELQIRELEHANQAKQLQLAAANAQAAEHEQQMSRQKLVLAGAGAGLAALAIIVALLFKLLRVQKKYGAELSVQALRDPLTGVDNRRALFTNMRELLARATPQNEHALLLIDLDHFKRINDSHGHPAGDAVLVAVAMQLKQQLQGRCSLARLGGEEFAVLCPAGGRDAALALAEELRLAVAGTSVRDLPVPTQVTASIGVAMFEGRGSLDDWMRAVDRALYAAKARGRNCVVEAASVRVNVA